jgi:hypothetical protein
MSGKRVILARTFSIAVSLSVMLTIAASAQEAVVYQPTLDRVLVFTYLFESTSNDLYAKYQNGQRWVWEDQGLPQGVKGIGPASVVYQPTLDRISAFVRGDNGHLYDRYWSQQQGAWEDQGLPPGVSFILHPNAVYQPTLDRIVVFMDGSDGHLYDKYWNGQQWVWEDQGVPPGLTGIDVVGTAVYQPTLDRITVFETASIAGGPTHLYDKYWNGQQWAWEDQGLPFGVEVYGSDRPSAVYQPTLNRLTVFVIGEDGHLYDKYWNGQQWVWEDQGLPPGATFLGNPTAIYEPASDRLLVFVTDKGRRLYDKYWNGQRWVWEDQGTPPGTDFINTICGAGYQPTLDRTFVFVIGGDGGLNDKYSNGNEWVWENQGFPNPPDFTVFAFGSTQSVIAGNTAQFAILTEGLNGFNDNIILSVSGYPPGGTASFNPSSGTGGYLSFLNIPTSPSTPRNTYKITVAGTSQHLSRSIDLTLVVK